MCQKIFHKLISLISFTRKINMKNIRSEIIYYLIIATCLYRFNFPITSTMELSIYMWIILICVDTNSIRQGKNVYYAILFWMENFRNSCSTGSTVFFSVSKNVIVMSISFYLFWMCSEKMVAENKGLLVISENNFDSEISIRFRYFYW